MLACCPLLFLSLPHHFLLSTLQRKEHTILLTNKVMMVCLISTYILQFFYLPVSQNVHNYVAWNSLLSPFSLGNMAKFL